MMTQENIPYTAEEIKAMVKTIESLRKTQKKYKQALERARKELQEYTHKDCDNMTRRTATTTIYSLFPELKESEDEKIRKVLLNDFKNNCSEYYCDGVTRDMIIAWLEKQGENNQEPVQKPFDYEHATIHQKDFAPKDGPKFKVGDWIVENGVNGNTVQITKFEEDKGVGIRVWFSNGTGTYIDFLKGYHLWTINDAKDGDVLVNSKGQPFIFSGKYDDIHFDSPIAYCGVNCQNKFKEGNGTHWTSKKGVTPATKEQRDFLFEKMGQAGYEWDAEKKELKKIIMKVGKKSFYLGSNPSNKE